MSKFIFITGGVVSSLGKGLASAALGTLLQSRGYKVRLRKLDPYLNVDPGTMSPYQHGEVYVTDDGAETDLDLGHYERFTGVPAKKSDNVTTGQLYMDVLSRERRGDYLGATIQVIPHVTDAIKEFVKSDISDEDFILCEIGGTVGDIESLPFLEAIRQPKTTTVTITREKKTRMEREVARRTPIISMYSSCSSKRCSIRNTRNTRSRRMTMSEEASGTNSVRKVGRMANKSTTPQKLMA